MTATTSGPPLGDGFSELVTGRRRYEVVRKLGAGGMAEVYLCTMFAGEGFSRPIALKIIRDDFTHRKAFCDQFAREARLASMLSHPNIVHVIDFDQDTRGRLFLAMEYIDGVDLHALVAGRVVPASVAIYLASEILRGLGYAHALPSGGEVRGIVHRDVSPQNVLLSWHGAIKVADFGIAKALSTSGVISGFKGKAAYMSPEQAAGDPIDGRSDLFSLGVVLWEMLTGRRLFQGQQAREVISRIMLGDIAPPSSVQPVALDLEQVVMKLLANHREDRYATARDATSALLACQDAPKNGPGELVAYLGKRFPSGRQHAQPAPAGTTASMDRPPTPATNTDTDTTQDSVASGEASRAASAGAASAGAASAGAASISAKPSTLEEAASRQAGEASAARAGLDKEHRIVLAVGAVLVALIVTFLLSGSS